MKGCRDFRLFLVRGSVALNSAEDRPRSRGRREACSSLPIRNKNETCIYTAPICTKSQAESYDTSKFAFQVQGDSGFFLISLRLYQGVSGHPVGVPRLRSHSW